MITVSDDRMRLFRLRTVAWRLSFGCDPARRAPGTRSAKEALLLERTPQRTFVEALKERAADVDHRHAARLNAGLPSLHRELLRGTLRSFDVLVEEAHVPALEELLRVLADAAPRRAVD